MFYENTCDQCDFSNKQKNLWIVIMGIVSRAQ